MRETDVRDPIPHRPRVVRGQQTRGRGAAGAVPSITSVNVPLAVLTFPATSITRTVSAYVPSESEVEGLDLRTYPHVVDVPVPITVPEPFTNWIVEFGEGCPRQVRETDVRDAIPQRPRVVGREK